MTAELTAVFGFVTVALACVGFVAGRQSASHSAGREAGAMAADVKHIKETTERIEKSQHDDRIRSEAKIAELDKRVDRINETVTKAKTSANSAHKRLDEHYAREHNINVEKREWGES